jgi:hypothetical protein
MAEDDEAVAAEATDYSPDQSVTDSEGYGQREPVTITIGQLLEWGGEEADEATILQAMGDYALPETVEDFNMDDYPWMAALESYDGGDFADWLESTGVPRESYESTSESGV